MDLNLQPLSPACVVSGEEFAVGERVASFLVRHAQTGEIVRHDMKEAAAAAFTPSGPVACRWVKIYKPRVAGEDSDRTMKLTAENLFVTLADPATDPSPDNVRLVQFLALMLERKKVLRPKGLNHDRTKNVFERAKTKELFEVPIGEFTPEFFRQVQAQLSVLTGEPKKAVAEPASATPAVPAA
jgi:hypothetical protein